MRQTGKLQILLRNKILPWLGLAMAILLGYYAFKIYITKPGSDSKPVVFSATPGSLTGSRGQIAKLLHKGLRREKDVTLNLVATAGSLEALELAHKGEIDVALIQGGLQTDDFSNVRLVAVLHVEPLHLLVKGKELFNAVSERVESLKGKRVNLSREGSGTRIFASQLMTLANLNPEVDFESTNYSYHQLLELSDQDMPDAVLTVSSQPSPIVRHLVTKRGFFLVSLPYADSLRINGLFDADSPIDRLQIVTATVPAFLYGLDPPQPAQNVETLGVNLLVIANANADPLGIRRICEYLYEGGFTKSFDDRVSHEKLASSTMMKLHPGAAKYLESKSPASTEQVIEVTEQLLAIAGSSLGALLFMWHWWKRRNEKRRDYEFVQHIERVVEIENNAIRYESLEELTVDDLLEMQQELAEIKSNMLGQYKSGYLEGADMLSTFLKHVNDTSELISRIVLHEVEPKSRTHSREMDESEPDEGKSD